MTLPPADSAVPAEPDRVTGKLIQTGGGFSA